LGNVWGRKGVIPEVMWGPTKAVFVKVELGGDISP
jgi:hypothetical protein